jgi:hypothetical protein
MIFGSMITLNLKIPKQHGPCKKKSIVFRKHFQTLYFLVNSNEINKLVHGMP